MNKLLERQKLPKQTQGKNNDPEQIHITTKKTESAQKIFPQRKVQAQMTSLVNSIKYLKKK